MAPTPYLAVARLDDRRPESRVFLAAAIEAEDVRRLFAGQILVDQSIEIDQRSGSVVSRRREKLGAITLRESVAEPDPDDLYDGGCPTLILTGTEDAVHADALVMAEKIPGAELRLIPGAGHACQLEQPWLFDRYMLEFLRHHGILDG